MPTHHTGLSPFRDLLAVLPGMIKAERERRCLSQAAAAIEIGIARPTLHNIERGSVPHLLPFLAICDWLRTPPHMFSYYAGDNSNATAYQRGWNDCATHITNALQKADYA